jgi:hypothetical protein
VSTCSANLQVERAALRPWWLGGWLGSCSPSASNANGYLEKKLSELLTESLPSLKANRDDIILADIQSAKVEFAERKENKLLHNEAWEVSPQIANHSEQAFKRRRCQVLASNSQVLAPRIKTGECRLKLRQ